MSKSNDAGSSDEEEQAERDHLEGMTDGCGCAEVWENLSEYRQESD